MQLTPRHAWDMTPREAIALQRELAAEIRQGPPLAIDEVRLVAGVDVSVKAGVSHAAVVVARFPDFAVVETVLARAPTPFPYVPGLLSFREGPVLEQAFARLGNVPDVFIFDGNGIAHPRRIGIASHMGLWLGRPTLGCAKSLLVGTHAPVGPERGDRAPLLHRQAGGEGFDDIGTVLRTRANVAPVIVSPGHLIDAPSAVDLVLACARRFRLPEPIRLAHKAAGEFSPAVDEAG